LAMLIHHPANSGWLVNKTGAMPRAYAEFSHKSGAILFLETEITTERMKILLDLLCNRRNRLNISDTTLILSTKPYVLICTVYKTRPKKPQTQRYYPYLLRYKIGLKLRKKINQKTCSFDPGTATQPNRRIYTVLT
jgi:hypothetical protein